MVTRDYNRPEALRQEARRKQACLQRRIQAANNQHRRGFTTIVTHRSA